MIITHTFIIIITVLEFNNPYDVLDTIMKTHTGINKYSSSNPMGIVLEAQSTVNGIGNNSFGECKIEGVVIIEWQFGL
jgi:hypothetical protein